MKMAGILALASGEFKQPSEKVQSHSHHGAVTGHWLEAKLHVLCLLGAH